MSDDFDGVDEIFDAFVEDRHAPGVAYGVVDHGHLTHAGGAGVTQLDHPTTPDENSVFRIASLTKSFTAAAVLRLRDDGRLSLDDRIVSYVPQLISQAMPTTDSPPLTIRHLLTMSGGLPTDDAWADRQESMTEEDFGAFLAEGIRFVSTPGTAFEYSNLGFALLGQVITCIAGREYRQEVSATFLEPLGLRDTVFAARDVHPGRLVVGHRPVAGGWVAVPFDRPGVFSAIGGLYSTVADLARWLGGFTDAFPPRDDPDDHPLSRATRREMQQQHRTFRSPSAPPTTGIAVVPPSVGYGYGLFVDEHPSAGPIVRHPGGYPGYGAHMAWSTTSGIGIVALANGRYAPVTKPVTEALNLLLAHRIPPPPAPWPETEQAASDVQRLLAQWDDTLADRIFADNVDLDLPRQDRRRDFEAAATAAGISATPEPPPAEGGKAMGPAGVLYATPASANWKVEGTAGSAVITIQLTPQRTPKIQSVSIDVTKGNE